MSEAPATAADVPAEIGFGRLWRRRAARAVAFPELVWTHFLRQKELRDRHLEPYQGPAEQRYRAFEARLEARNREIESAYWCRNEASAVVLTIKRRPRSRSHMAPVRRPSTAATHQLSLPRRLLMDGPGGDRRCAFGAEA
jgi:hypothetical protein